MTSSWLNSDEFNRAGTGKREAGVKTVQPDRHGSSAAKSPAAQPKSSSFIVSVKDGQVTIRDKKRR